MVSLPKLHVSVGLLFSVLLLLLTVTHENHANESREINKLAKTTQHQQIAVPALTPKQQMSAHTEDLRQLMLQLYKIYPEELAKSTQVGAREMTEWVFDGKANWKFDAIRGMQGKEALKLMAEQSYQGDIVMPLVVGLETLLFTAYGAKNEFDIPSDSNALALKQVSCEMQSLQQQLNQVQPESSSPSMNQWVKKAYEKKQITVLLNGTLQTILDRISANQDVKGACHE